MTPIQNGDEGQSKHPAAQVFLSLLGIGVGIVLFHMMSSAQNDAMQLDLHEHATLASKAANESLRQIRLVADINVFVNGEHLDTTKKKSNAKGPTPLAALDTVSAKTADTTYRCTLRSPPKTPATPDQRLEFFAHVSAARVLSFTALDALDRVQSVAHEKGLRYGQDLSTKVSAATGQGDIVGITDGQLAQLLLPNPTNTTGKADAWVTTAEASCAALSGFSYTVLDASKLEMPDTASTHPRFLPLAEGRTSGTYFGGKLILAISYVLIANGVLVLLLAVFKVSDQFIDLLKGAFAGSKTGVTSAGWSLIASVSVAASLGTAYALTKPKLAPEPTFAESSHIQRSVLGGPGIPTAELMGKVNDVLKQLREATERLGKLDPRVN